MVTEMNPGKNKLYAILQQYPQFFDSILPKKDEYKIQIIYTQINRNKEGIPGFTDYTFNVNKNNYYYQKTGKGRGNRKIRFT